MTDASSQIMQIANRIQQKATALTEEQHHLQNLQDELQSLTHQRKKQRLDSESLRISLLQKLQSRHGMELEGFQRKRDLQDRQSKIDKYKDQIILLENEIVFLQEKMKKEEEQTYTPHLVKIELYQRTLDHKVQECRSKKRLREKELDSFVFQRERNLEEANGLKREEERVETEIGVLKQVEGNEIQEIAALSMQIRMTISKRASLRSALKDARERNEVANQKMIKWEEECMKKTG
mmetsp:Transcript_2006/g.3051  ORF Transcript_2006/g.3051 Transcript_2006/m.3051 type:complete len:236 (+) Transcript_2006:90-797(+)